MSDAETLERMQQLERDGGFRYFGAGNVFPAGESSGHAQCEPCGCTVMFGDNPGVRQVSGA